MQARRIASPAVNELTPHLFNKLYPEVGFRFLHLESIVNIVGKSHMILKILQRVSIHTLHDYCLGFFPERSSGEKLISQFVVRSFHLLPLPEPLLPRRLLVLGVHIFARGRFGSFRHTLVSSILEKDYIPPMHFRLPVSGLQHIRAQACRPCLLITLGHCHVQAQGEAARTPIVGGHHLPREPSRRPICTDKTHDTNLLVVPGYSDLRRHPMCRKCDFKVVIVPIVVRHFVQFVNASTFRLEFLS